ncbi:CBS domain-containing protein [Azospirillum doebereinerae]|uniref:CBS domain-containing protein n=1 Tax=Azospirillum doebereinerae TaxID=92933 RepID=A0A3S0V3J2_9PROT|nr:CBS domain-containing protein [Azospirillum doebereinerae]MCG5242964.1 CBS domain-containing protein [Azospirillum doebereinerae]RUQ65197.1 CBS domain-containing protein [Azospirillum doebereinerae]
MHVAAVLKRKGNRIVAAAQADTVSAIAQLLTEHRIGAVLVLEEDGSPVGILSERDIVRAIARDGAAALSRPAAELMTRELITGQPTDTVADLMAVMTDRRIRHIPILEDGRIVGVISIGDVVKARIDDAELEVESLRGFVAGIG